MRVTPCLALALSTLVLTGCSGGSTAGRFDPGGGDDISCMEHQGESPDATYTGGQDADAAAILTVFRYYVSNGDKPYCDGEQPTSVDREWAQLVVDLGGSRDNVSAILEGG